MIRVLVMADESVLANYITVSLAQELDLDVFRVTRNELGSRRDFSIVIIIEDELDERETIKLKEILRADGALLLIRVSLKNRNVYVDESYHLVNPGMARMVDLLREFNSKSQTGKSQHDPRFQKKMNEFRDLWAGKHGLQPVNTKAEGLVALSTGDFSCGQEKTQLIGSSLPIMT